MRNELGTTHGGADEGLVKLLTTAETASVLRIGRRSVEELGKKYDRAKGEFPVGEPPPSCPSFGLRRTPVTPRRHFYNEGDVTEYLVNCRRESDELEPVRLNSDRPRVANERSKSKGLVRG